MPLSQDDLRTHVAKEKKKGQSPTEQYSDPDMKGFKKKQVDRLLQERNRDETDPRFVYELASLKLVQKMTKQTIRQTTAMQIILKRVYSPDNDRSLALGPPKSFATAGFDRYISPFHLAEVNEHQDTPRSQSWKDYKKIPTYPAPKVCVSPLKVLISFVSIVFENAACLLRPLCKILIVQIDTPSEGRS